MKRARTWIGIAAALVSSCCFSRPCEAGVEYRRVTIPIEVTGLPGGADYVPVSRVVDFSAIRATLKLPGVVDSRSLRLWRVAPDGSEVQQAVQFSPAPQPRTRKRAFLPGTVPGVSYIAEFAAVSVPPEIRVAGTLTWLARADDRGRQRYRLRVGVARTGRAIQVPYPPRDLHVFDDQHRATPLGLFPRMQIRPQWPLHGELHLLENNRLVTTYHLGPTPEDVKKDRVSLRRPFFYPVNGPGGVSLTEFGKSHDPTGSHAHHYSLWIAHANVAGRDFWSERGGVIVHAGFELLEDGPVFCRLVQRTRWIDGDTTVLRGRRSITLYRTPQGTPQARNAPRAFDVDLELSPPGKEPVELGKTTFGFLAVRVAPSMTPFDGGGEIVNSRGQRNEQAVHLQRAEWLDQSGPIRPAEAAPAAPGQHGAMAPPEWAGIAVLDHPANPGHPTTWHCRNDGWAGASFNAAGPYTTKPGEPLRLRYRLLLHEGNAAAGHVGDRYADYAAEPKVVLGQAVSERGE